jgi:hypothetical protein
LPGKHCSSRRARRHEVAGAGSIRSPGGAAQYPRPLPSLIGPSPRMLAARRPSTADQDWLRCGGRAGWRASFVSDAGGGRRQKRRTFSGGSSWCLPVIMIGPPRRRTAPATVMPLTFRGRSRTVWPHDPRRQVTAFDERSYSPMSCHKQIASRANTHTASVVCRHP